ncbi:MAG: branched-chain amino acid ABC transporter permease, partial [Proteobacteria bacterium]|nr:branched-chain amino acid ABC transporter permease [Pseudomonadota bacterium]
MTNADVYLQQVINGTSLGAMYALLALGFTLVYGILELINFAHFNVFMVGSFVGLAALEGMGVTPGSGALTGLPLVGVLLVAFV